MDDLTMRRFKVLSDKNRVKILRLLEEHSLTVNELVAGLAIDRTLASHHLKVLRDENLITSSKLGRFQHYRLSDEVREKLAEGAYDFGCCEIKFH